MSPAVSGILVGVGGTLFLLFLIYRVVTAIEKHYSSTAGHSGDSRADKIIHAISEDTKSVWEIWIFMLRLVFVFGLIALPFFIIAWLVGYLGI